MTDDSLNWWHNDDGSQSVTNGSSEIARVTEIGPGWRHLKFGDEAHPDEVVALIIMFGNGKNMQIREDGVHIFDQVGDFRACM